MAKKDSREGKEGEEKTHVIFRVYPDGELIAIFPREVAAPEWWICESYVHVGQHGACDPELVIRDTRPAKRAEYKDLYEELVGLGYELIVRKRYTRLDRRIREEQYRRIYCE